MTYLPDTDVAAVCLGLATLLHSGMDLSYGASMLPEPRGKAAAEAVKALKAGCADGLPLSEALPANAFPPYMAGLVRMGEETGRLEQALYALSDYYYKKDARARRIRSALSYPLVLAALMLAVAGILLVKVLPVFDRVYASLGGSMTGAAGTLLSFGQALGSALPVLLAVLAVLLAACVATALVPSLRTAFLSAVKRAMGDKGPFRAANDARFAQAMAMGLASGMPLDEAVKLSSGLNAGVPAAEARYARCQALVESGEAVTDALSASGALPADACALLSLGQSSGTVDSLMASISDRLSAEADEAVDKISARVEPALVLASTLIAGAILVSVMLPLMDVMAAMR